MSRSLKRMLLLSTFLFPLAVLTIATSTAGKPPKDDGGLTNPAIVYHNLGDSGLLVMSADGSIRQQLTRPRRAAADRNPTWSPDGNWIGFWRSDGNGDGGALYKIKPDGSQETLIRSLVPSEGLPIPGWHADDLVWTPDPDTTRLVFACDTAPARGIWMVRGKPDLPPRKLVSISSYQTEAGHHVASPTFSPDLDPDSSGYQGLLTWSDYELIDVGGRYLQLVGDIYALGIAIDDEGHLTSVGEPMNLTAHLRDAGFPNAYYGHPAWSPPTLDGVFLAFIMDETSDGGSTGIALMAADGTILPVAGTATEFSRISWSPAGDYIVFTDIADSTGTWDIFRIDLENLDTVNLTATDRAKEWSPSWNPAWTNDIVP